MKPFTLSRLETDHGTFRVSGTHLPNRAHVTSLELLSTDGWVSLDLEHPNVPSLVDALEADVLLALSEQD